MRNVTIDELKQEYEKNAAKTATNMGKIILHYRNAKHDLRNANDTLKAVCHDMASLKRRLDTLQVKHNEVLTAIRAWCDESDMEYEGKLGAGLRQFVWDKSDDEARIEMEGMR